MYRFEWWTNGIKTGAYHCGDKQPHELYNEGLEIGLKMLKERDPEVYSCTIWFDDV